MSELQKLVVVGRETPKGSRRTYFDEIGHFGRSGAHFLKSQLSVTEQTKPRLVKDVTYIFPAGGATSETMAKNVVMEFGVSIR